MARLSASVTEETKAALYETAQRDGVAVSHLVQAALDHYFRAALPQQPQEVPDLEAVHRQLGQLTSQIESLRHDLGRGERPRFF